MYLQKGVIFIFFVTAGFNVGATPVQSIAINPTVTAFDSIPSVTTERTFIIRSVQDTSIQRNLTGIVGSTRVRHRKMAPLNCTPLPVRVIEKSVDGLLSNKGLKAQNDTINAYSLEIIIWEFSLTETSKKLSQTMEANIVLQVTVIGPEDEKQAISYVIRSQNSKTTIETSKYAASILEGAIENSLKELIKNIVR